MKHLGIEAETASAILLTIENIDAMSMRVTIESANNDAVDFLLVNDITGSPQISPVDKSVAGKLSVMLTWDIVSPTDVAMNVLWSKASFGGNWQLAQGVITVPFAATCGDGGGDNETVANIIAFPIDFECAFTAYSFTEFGGAPTTVEDNPDASGINTSSKVAKMTKVNDAATFAGAILTLENPIDFNISAVFKMKVWSPKVGAIVKLKLENLTDGAIANEIDAPTTVAESWEELTFDFSNTDANTKSLQKLVLFFDFGNAGDGSVYYFDDIIQQGNTAVVLCQDPNNSGGGDETAANIIAFPIDFECAFTAYSFTEFGGAPTTVEDNPDASGINTSSKVAKMTKVNDAATFAGAILTLENPIDFNISAVFKMKVWSPKVGAIVKLKLENLTDGAIANEIDAPTTVAESWEELTFDFSNTDANTKSLQKLVLFFDFGNAGDGSVYYFDDIIQQGNTAVVLCQEPMAATMPTNAPLPPKVCDNVISLFSDAYGENQSIVVDTWKTGWSPAQTVAEEVIIADNPTRFYDNLSFVGVEMFENPVDAINMTNFHVDFWTPNMTSFKIKLVHFGEEGNPEGEFVVENPAQREWVSLDIPMSIFADLGLSEVSNITQLIFSGDSPEGGTVYLDNIYFSGTCNVIQPCPTEPIWADEFNGNTLNLTDWTPLIGDGCDINLCGWGNNELQWYQAENAVVSDGTLKIIAKRESVGGRDFTSARIVTENKQEFTYGRFEASIKLPTGAGTWPAFWLLHTRPGVYGVWPQSGELDVMEFVGQTPKEILGTAHFGNLNGGYRFLPGKIEKLSGTYDDGEFYEFAMEWEENEVRWFVDDYLYYTVTRADVEADGFFWPFDQPFHILLNVAMGGNLGGAVDPAFQESAMEVEYVRVYKANFPYLTGNQKVPFAAEGEMYSVENGGEGTTYNWTVQGGTITQGQGTNKISVNWNDDKTEGEVSVSFDDACEEGMTTIDLEVEIDVKRVAVLECVLEDFDNQGLIAFFSQTGTFEDNAADPTNAANLVGKYVRNTNETFDNLQFNTSAIPNAAKFDEGSSTFFMDVYTDAPEGTVILLQLESSETSIPTNFPTGRHSVYQAITGAPNTWNTLEFKFNGKPDGENTADTDVDRIVFLFASNSNNGSTFYFDNLERKCTDTEANCATAAFNCNPVINNIVNNRDDEFMVVDPCSCTDPLNVTVGGQFLFHDVLTVTATPGQLIQVVANDGEFRDATDTPITVPVTVPEVVGMPGVYQLDFYHRSGLATTITVQANSNPATNQSFTSSLCDVATCAPVVAVPTMSEWGLLIFTLFLLNVVLVFLYNKERGAINVQQ